MKLLFRYKFHNYELFYLQVIPKNNVSDIAVSQLNPLIHIRFLAAICIFVCFPPHTSLISFFSLPKSLPFRIRILTELVDFTYDFDSFILILYKTKMSIFEKCCTNSFSFLAFVRSISTQEDSWKHKYCVDLPISLLIIIFVSFRLDFPILDWCN